MGLFQQFPYSNFHDLNLDWLINEIKKLGNQAVLSVNGQTGDVVLYQSENIVFPEVNANTWRMVRVADGHTAGVMFQNGLMYVMFDNAAERVYTVDHPPTFPVTSVDGQTGDVTVFPDAGTRLADVTDDYTNIRRQIRTNGVDNVVGIEVKADTAYRMKDTSRVPLYDADNPPPYPVTSVNGQTGAVVLAIPFSNVSTADVMFSQAVSGHEWSIGRETTDGISSIQIRTDSTKAEAWIDFFTEDSPQVTYSRKLLTTDDIPSSSGVISVNGMSGVVSLNAENIPAGAGSQQTIDDRLDADEAEILSLGGDITDIQDDIDDIQGDITNIQGDISDIQDDITDIQAAISGGLGPSGDGLAYIVDGDTAAAPVPKGAYAFLKNNTHGLADGFYENVSSGTFPTTGGTATSSIFSAVATEGILNLLNDKMAVNVITSGISTIDIEENSNMAILNFNGTKIGNYTLPAAAAAKYKTRGVLKASASNICRLILEGNSLQVTDGTGDANTAYYGQLIYWLDV